MCAERLPTSIFSIAQAGAEVNRRGATLPESS
jgi:hypothetical protein